MKTKTEVVDFSEWDFQIVAVAVGMVVVAVVAVAAAAAVAAVDLVETELNQLHHLNSFGLLSQTVHNPVAKRRT